MVNRVLRALLVLSGGLVSAASAHAACPATPEQVEAEAKTAIGAFSAGSKGDAAFDKARDAMREGLSCLSAAPTPRQAALVHEAEALASIKTKDYPRAQLYFQAMGESDPSLTLGEDVAPAEGLVERQVQAAKALPPSGRTALALPKGYALSVDGAPSPTRPTDRPAIVVILELDGGVYSSGMVLPGATVPVPGADPIAREVGDDPQRSPLPWFIAAGGAAVAAGGMWAVGQRGTKEIIALQADIEANATEDEVGMTYEEASAAYDRTRAMRVAAPVTAGVAVGLGAVGVVVWRW